MSSTVTPTAPVQRDETLSPFEWIQLHSRALTIVLVTGVAVGLAWALWKRSDAINFAKLNRVLLGQDAHGVPIDVSLSGMPFETEMIERSQQREYLIGKFIRICGASDLVILKAFANRVRDWQDIRGILIRSACELNWDLIETELKILTELKEEPEILTKLGDLRKSLSSN